MAGALQYSSAQVSHVHFFVDNTAALKSIFDLKPATGQAHTTRSKSYGEKLLGRDSPEHH
jgi:hypothetical protein